MGKFLFALICYILGMSSLVALFVFLEFHPDTPPPSFSSGIMLWNVLVFLVFPLQHSILARSSVQDWIQKYTDPRLIRSIYVGTSGVALWWVLFMWRPMGPMMYRIDDGIFLDVIFFSVLILIILSTAALDHSSMFGLKQGYAAWKETELPPPAFTTRGLYGVVRHPITSGFLVVLWSHDSLTAGRLLLNVLFSVYAILGTILEERSLIDAFGDDYKDYRKRVPAFIPWLRGASDTRKEKP